jgi:predicted component of viral defense system (DUF524 family)
MEMEAPADVMCSLEIWALQGDPDSPSPIWDQRDERSEDQGLESIQLVEDGEYRYRVITSEVGDIRLEPLELFSADPDSSGSGRLRTRSHVGLLPIEAYQSGRLIGRSYVEVRSRKLDYASHYRWMLNDLVDFASSIVQERFAPIQQRVRPSETLDAATAYERFSLLQAALTSPDLEAAFAYVLGRPHHDWISEPEYRHPGAGLPATSQARRQLLRPGPRIDWPMSQVESIRTLPRTLSLSRPDETLDTPPNRFVKFVLLHWLSMVLALRGAVSLFPEGAPRRRGLRETGAVIDRLNALLGEPVFRGVGNLTMFPVDNQVLQKREGYRDILRAYVQIEGATQLTWRGGDQVFGIGQRNVATLYEYWTFIELVRVVRELCDEFDASPLVKMSDDTLGIGLSQGSESALSGHFTRLGRQVTVRMYFNRTFSRPRGSWTRTMRPDASIELSAPRSGESEFDSAWLHFDAKYRADQIFQLLGSEGGDDDDVDAVSESATAKRVDLLKMHAYRDAIRRSVGSFVLYPGLPDAESTPNRFEQYREILPGLGAFRLRPSGFGASEGRTDLSTFLAGIFDHFASVMSEDRRNRYWESIVFGHHHAAPARIGWAPIAWKPPADTHVLVGYVKRGQLAWVLAGGRYNLRGDERHGAVGLASRELAADLLILYGPEVDEPQLWSLEGEPEVWSQDRMRASRYPEPRSAQYFCLQLGQRIEGGVLPTASQLEALRASAKPGSRHGTPFVLSWLELADLTGPTN